VRWGTKVLPFTGPAWLRERLHASWLDSSCAPR